MILAIKLSLIDLILIYLFRAPEWRLKILEKFGKIWKTFGKFCGS